ncbi:MAG: glyoxalase [Actinobacteria bacterium]|nr:MAG: glyoxalase [Actinomycetota bacterium]
MSPRSPSRWRSRWTATWRRRSGARRGSFRTRRRPRTTVGPSTSSRASSPPPRWSRHASYRRLVAIDPRVDIGHVHLKVSDIDRALGFYRDVLGFEETTRYGDQAVFISAGGYHHHIGLNTWESLGGSPPPPGTTGLYHVAIRYPTRAALADALRRVLEARIPLSGASDHGVSEAIYLHDPDENGIELYWDRPKDQWPREGGKVTMYTRPLDLEGLLAEAT